MFDSEYVGAWDLKGDTTVQIVRVQAGKVKNKDGERAVVYD
jgi:hypothetical protein